MAALSYFTVVGNYFAAAGDGPYDAGDPNLIPMAGPVTFTPIVTPGDTIDGSDLTPPTNLYLARVKASVKNGRIQINGESGVRLVANTAVLNLDGDLYYKVEFPEGLKARGVTYSLKSFTFQAPTADVVIDLVDVTPEPGQPAGGITKIAPGGVRFDSSSLIFTFGGVDLPDPIPFSEIFEGPIADEIATAVPPAVAAVVPGVVTSDLQARTPTVEDLGGGHGRINIGTAHGPSFTWPANGWSGITGRPTVLDGTTTGAQVRAAIDHSSAFYIGGDSLSAGTLNDDVSVANPKWPDTFAAALGVDVVNLAQGGAASANIATRLGALQPLITLASNKITAGSYPSNVVTVTAISPSDGWHNSVIAGNQLDIFGTIAGVAGILRQDFSVANTFKFLPFATLGADVPVSAGTPFICTGDGAHPTDDGSQHRDKTLIIWFGPNNDQTNTTAMIRDVTSMQNHLTSAGKKFYLLSMTSDGSNAIAANAALKAAFPKQWIDVRGYLMTNGLADAGITPTGSDTTAIAAGNIPRSFRPLSSVHMTQTAYDVVGRYVAKVIADNAVTVAGKPVALGGSISKAEIVGLAGTDYADPAVDSVFRHAVGVGEATILREMADSNVSCSSGIRRYVMFKARKTETITQVRTVCTAAAVTTPNPSTLCRIGVWQIDPTTGDLINGAVTANTTSLWTATGAYTTALTTSFSKVRGMWVCAAVIQIGASTAPTIMGHSGVGASEMGVAPRLAAAAGGQTDIGSAAFVSAASLTGDTAARPYVVLLP
jgi:hypothetical protein